MIDMDRLPPKPFREVGARDNSSLSLRQEPVIMDEVVLAQLQIKSGSSLRAMETHPSAMKGTFMFLPTIEEATSAHKDPELDDLFKQHLKGMKQLMMWTYINLKSGYTVNGKLCH